MRSWAVARAARGTRILRGAAPVAAVLAAAALRGWRLDHMSTWQDEGLSFFRAMRPLADLLSGTIVLGDLPTMDVHPPLYFLLLGGWFRVLGSSTWAAKAFSLLASLPTVALVWALARRTGGRRAAAASAVVAAIAPVYLWYAQEVRSYTLAISLAAMAGYALLRALDGPDGAAAGALARAGASAGTRAGAGGRSRARWAAAAAAALAALAWTHYLGLLLAASLALGALAVLVVRDGGRGARARGAWSALRWPAAAMAIAALAAAPLLPNALWRLGIGAERDQHFVPLDIILGDVPRGLGVGRTLVAPGDPPVADAVAAALAFGWIGALVLGALRIRRRGDAAFLLAWLLGPVFGVYALTLVKPIYLGVQHILLASPAFMVLAGAGLAAAWERRPTGGARAGPLAGTAALSAAAVALAGAALLAGAAVADARFYAEPTVAKDDLRGLAAYVDARAVPGDVLAVSDPVLELSFGRLVRRVPVVAVPRMTATGLLDARPAGEQIGPLLATHRRIWFMTPQDDHAAYLAAHALLVDREEFHGASIPVRVEAWEPPPSAAEGTMPRRGPWSNDPDLGGLGLMGWEVVPDCVEAGTAARVRLVWQPLRAVPRYKVALRLVDDDNAPLGDGDHEPFHGERPTTAWPLGEVVYEPHDLLVGAYAPPGDHRLSVGVYDPETGETFPKDGPLPLQRLCVSAAGHGPETASIPIGRRLRAAGGGLELLGYDPPAPSIAPGAALTVDAWVRLASGAPGAAVLRLEVLDGLGRRVRVASAAAPLGDPGQVRRVRLRTAGPAGAGRYRLRVRLASADGRTLWMRRGAMPVRGLYLGETVVVPTTRRQEAPPMGRALQVDVGEEVSLLGFDPPSVPATAGEPLVVTLYWRARTPVSTDYRVTVQLVPAGGPGGREASGPPLAQHDGTPADGSRPTTGWLAGEVVTDRHAIDVPPGLLPGRYLLVAALYDPSDPAAPRPPVRQDGAEHDYVVLQEVDVIQGGER